MIGKQKKGRGFRGLLDYLEQDSPDTLVGGNMFGENARELTKEFKISRQLNPEVERAVYHVSLSAAPDDYIDEELWKEIAHKYLDNMGFDCNQYAIYRHSNTDNDHIHIVASRIRLDTGKVVHDGWDYLRSEKVLREIEKEYGLFQVKSREKQQKAPSTGQIKRIEREQFEYDNGLRQTPPEKPIKQKLQQAINKATLDNPTLPLMIARLQIQGIEVKAGFTRNGKSKGISYCMDSQAFSGTNLGAAYTFNGLQKHLGVDYQEERDSEPIKKLISNPNLALEIAQRYHQQQQQLEKQKKRRRGDIER
ncbi:MAG: relaxase/mobilization nuclease domain-containing protein [Richelia sp. RM2_1_2]|nr:relaxase/mobilization nuclease domain-containing protein [Richelia sp. RM2_1_2]